MHELSGPCPRREFATRGHARRHPRPSGSRRESRRGSEHSTRPRSRGSCAHRRSGSECDDRVPQPRQPVAIFPRIRAVLLTSIAKLRLDGPHGSTPEKLEPLPLVLSERTGAVKPRGLRAPSGDPAPRSEPHKRRPRALCARAHLSLFVIAKMRQEVSRKKLGGEKRSRS